MIISIHTYFIFYGWLYLCVCFCFLHSIYATRVHLFSLFIYFFFLPAIPFTIFSFSIVSIHLCTILHCLITIYQWAFIQIHLFSSFLRLSILSFSLYILLPFLSCRCVCVCLQFSLSVRLYFNLLHFDHITFSFNFTLVCLLIPCNIIL